MHSVYMNWVEKKRKNWRRSCCWKLTYIGRE